MRRCRHPVNRHRQYLLTRAMRQCCPERLAYFAFDLLHLGGHDLRACAIEDRKALLRGVIGAAGCERIVVVDHVVGIGQQLFEAVRQIGAESIVSKCAGSAYCGGPSRDWLKVKVSETAPFVISGHIEREAVAVTERRDGELVPAGLVKFGLGGKELSPILCRCKAQYARFLPSSQRQEGFLSAWLRYGQWNNELPSRQPMPGLWGRHPG